MRYFLFLILFIIPSFLFSQTDKDNVVINTATEIYDFSQQAGNVQITKQSDAEYLATRKSETILVAEFYDKQSELAKVDVDGVNAKPTYHHVSDDEIFYSDDKVCYYELPIKFKDKKVTVHFKKRYNDPRYFGPIYFADPYFIKSKTIKLIVPDWVDVEIIEKNFNNSITKQVIHDGKNTQYIFDISNQDATKTEANMQGRSFIYPHILVRVKTARLKDKTENYFNTLSDLYDWYRQIADKMNNDKQAIKAKSDEIIAGCTSDMEKIAKLFAWVQENIRYIAFEDGIAAFKPDDAQEVIKKKYGDCKGMANLTKELLSAQGFDARLTWLGTNHLAYDYRTPSIFVDNHMICTLFYNNRPYYLDATCHYLLPGEYPHSIQGRQVLIEDGPKYQLQKIPEFDPAFNKDSLHCEYAISNGKLIGKASYNLFGEAKYKILSIYNNTPTDKKELMLKSYFEKDNVLDNMENINLTGLRQNAKSVYINFDVTNQSTVQQVNNEYYLGLDMDKDMNELIFDTLKRVNDFLFTYKHNVVRYVELDIPAGYKITSKPADFVVETPKYLFSIRYIENKDKLIYYKKVVIKDLLIKKNEFKAWNEDLKKFNTAYLEQIILTKQ